MIIIKGNLLDTPIKFIAHQVNCMGVMGAGLAKSIKEKQRCVYEFYKKELEICGADGKFGFSDVVKGDDNHSYINIYGQYGYGRNARQTDYDKFKNAFEDAIRIIRMDYNYGVDTQIVIAIPYSIGCGLAGGDWDIVKSILEILEYERNVLFVAYKLER